MNSIQLSDHFDYRRLLRFTFPSICMMIFTSIYGVVDGLFISNYVGKRALAAVNIVWPFFMMLTTIGFMLGTGGAALISKTLGEKNRERANQIFSMVIYVTMISGLILFVFGQIFLRDICLLMGASEELLDICVEYGRILMFGILGNLFQMEFQSLASTAQNPKIALRYTIFAGVFNMVFDYVFVALLNWGVNGAALATVLGIAIGGFGPLLYFYKPDMHSLLKIGKFWFDGGSLLQICTNGVSELMSNISMSLVSMLYNAQLLRYAGETGMAAYGVMMYVSFVFISSFIGYSIGTAAIIGYHYGAENKVELKNVLKRSFIIIMVASITMVLLSEILARPLSNIFVSYDKELLEVTVSCFRIYSISYLFSGIAIFGSSFFTALNNGLISAIISFLRTVAFQVVAVIVLPIFFGLNGIWYSVIVAELCATILTIIFILANKKKYGYL